MQAKQDFPDLFKTGSETEQLAKKILAQVPELLRFPDGMIHLGIYAEALQAYVQKKRDAAAARNGKQTPKVSKAAQPFTKPQVKRAPALASTDYSRENSSSHSEPDVTAAEEQALETGGTEDSILNLVSSIRSSYAANDRSRRAPV